MQRFIWVLLIPYLSMSGFHDKIRRALEKSEFEKALVLILKAREKEPLNPAVDYYHSLLLSDSLYASYNLDSARVLINMAAKKFAKADEKLREKLEKKEVTSTIIQEYGISIRDRLYKRLNTALSVHAIEGFLHKYPGSPYDDLLIFQRDSIRFHEVSQLNVVNAYEQFIEEVQTEKYKNEAVRLLDDLRFQILGQSTDLSDHYRFLKDYPNTAHVRPIEQFIFLRSTAAGAISSYVDFLNTARNKYLKKRAGDILYHLDPSIDLLNKHPAYDSLKAIDSLRNVVLIPIMDNEKFGFYAEDGRLLIPHKFYETGARQKCEATSNEWLSVLDTVKKIISKKGKTILLEIDSYQDLAHGIVKVSKKGKWYVHHKSGFQVVSGPVDDVEVLNNCWIKVKREDKMGPFFTCRI